jgi:hypothetical protein
MHLYIFAGYAVHTLLWALYCFAKHANDGTLAVFDGEIVYVLCFFFMFNVFARVLKRVRAAINGCD